MNDADRWIDDYVRTEAHLLQQAYATYGDARACVDDRHLPGMQGEFEFARLIGQMPRGVINPKGDGGFDFDVALHYSVDVKTARKAFNLLHPASDPVADIYVLAEYTEAMQLARQRANLVGWEWGRILARAPVRDFGYGLLNNYIPRENLRPIDSLLQRLKARG